MDLNKTMIIDDYKCIIRNDYLQEMNDKILNRRFRYGTSTQFR